MFFSRCAFVISLLAVFAGCIAAPTTSETGKPEPDQAEDLSCLLQPHSPSFDLRTTPGRSSESKCADLTNHGTHFTVDIEVGTPGQKFSVIVDTGSDTLIIPSCICQQGGTCPKSDRCFQGTNHSSTFSLMKGGQGRDGLHDIFITFGSGTIEGVVAKEKVTVGQLSVDMKDGLLLMIARQLDLKGAFEGILGLGLPAKMHPKHLAHKASKAPANVKDLVKIIKGILGGHAQSNIGNTTFDDHDARKERMLQDQDANGGLESLPLDTPAQLPAGTSSELHLGDYEEVSPKGLLEQAGIHRFSMCFNDGSSGALRLGTPELKEPLGSVGSFHWGLDFRGVSIGDSVVPLSFCSVDNMTHGQETPCGAIPDSGTTLIMAPQEHLTILVDSLCDDWDRCAKNYSAMVTAAKSAKSAAAADYGFDPFHIQPASKSDVLQLLLLDCASWLTTPKGLNELPPLNFHVAGASGNKQTLKLPGWAYVFESNIVDAAANKKLQGMDHFAALLENKSHTFASHPSTKVCQLAFSKMAYDTTKNGPVWILGTPLFYEFQVGYDLGTSPPSLSFASTATSPCTTCGKQASLATSTSSNEGRQPRRISGPVRIPRIDTDLPL